MYQPPGASGDPDFMTSLARGLAVIAAFTERNPALTIAEVARITGLSRAAVRRCLHTLAVLGYAGRDGRSFHLQPRVLGLGYAFLSSTPLAKTLQPFLEQASRELGESCSAAVLDDDSVLYIGRAATRRIMSVALNVGSRLPTFCTSMGRVLLADLDEDSLAAHLARIELEPHTERTVTDPAALRHLLAGVRRDGYAIVDQELELGLRSIAVPVRNKAGRVVAAINVGTQAARVSSDEMRTRLLPVLRRVAEEVRTVLIAAAASGRH